MKLKDMKYNHYSERVCDGGPVVVPIRFEFSQPRAVTICVGPISEPWQPEAKTLYPPGGRSLPEGNVFDDTRIRIVSREGQSMQVRVAIQSNLAQSIKQI